MGVIALGSLSQQDKILVALHDYGDAEFTAEDVVVAAWKRFPDVFGLGKYYSQYPDSNKILASLMGARGLVGRKLLIRTDAKTYRFTGDGKKAVADLLGLNKPKIAYVDVSPDDQEELLRQQKCRGFQHYQEGNKHLLQSSMAWEFWAMPASAKGKQVDDVLGWMDRFYREMEFLLDGAVGRMDGGRLTNTGEVRLLANCHDYLKEKFSTHITLLKCRK